MLGNEHAREEIWPDKNPQVRSKQIVTELNGRRR